MHDWLRARKCQTHHKLTSKKQALACDRRPVSPTNRPRLDRGENFEERNRGPSIPPSNYSLSSWLPRKPGSALYRQCPVSGMGIVPLSSDRVWPGQRGNALSRNRGCASHSRRGGAQVDFHHRDCRAVRHSSPASIDTAYSGQPAKSSERDR